MSTIYCMNCGAELDGNARFCSECGSPTLLGAGLVESEAVRQISCPSCGALNDPAEKFCTSCGGALTQAPASIRRFYFLGTAFSMSFWHSSSPSS